MNPSTTETLHRGTLVENSRIVRVRCQRCYHVAAWLVWSTFRRVIRSVRAGAGIKSGGKFLIRRRGWSSWKSAAGGERRGWTPGCPGRNFCRKSCRKSSGKSCRKSCRSPCWEPCREGHHGKGGEQLLWWTVETDLIRKREMGSRRAWHLRPSTAPAFDRDALVEFPIVTLHRCQRCDDVAAGLIWCTFRWIVRSIRTGLRILGRCEEWLSCWGVGRKSIPGGEALGCGGRC